MSPQVDDFYVKAEEVIFMGFLDTEICLKKIS